MSHLIPPELDDPDADRPIEAPRWYAVVTALRQEKRAALAIMEAIRPHDRWHDLSVYLPCERRWVRHAGKKEIATRPLFPRYLFVCVRDEHLHLVRNAHGVDDFIRSGVGPAAFNPKRLNEIRDAEEAGEFDTTRDEFEGPFGAGEAVKVAVGKWADWPGTVLKMTGPNRVKVLLSMFGKEHEKELDVGSLKAA